MKESDFIAIIIWAAVICGFAFIPGACDLFNTTTANHGLLMSIPKFAILCTFGEMLSLRIREGVYLKKGFGLLPKIVIWGMIGVVIASAMIIFRAGTVRLLDGGFLNWDIHYGFVIAKTIPFYAIPANTIVFLLPPTLQVLAAALVGVSLGVVLSIRK